ncbi:choice-of-anchor D domain-containing protein, partial [candidate division KSB1 bacterium]|nr:choice-of-anchor D domain-containing protein [candidate division KSB1 bacterium]
KLPLEGEGRDYISQKIVLSSDTLIFGTVPTSSYQQMQLGIKNEGEKDLRIDSLKFFHQAYSAPKDTLHVRPGRTRELTINFKPTVPETIKSTMRIFHNDPSVSGISFVELIGVGREPNSQKIFVEQKEINFGDVAVGESGTQQLAIQNKGELPLQITNVQSSQTYFKPLKLELTLQPGETAPIDIMFSPQAIDTLKGKLTITSNDPEIPKIDVNLIGVGKKVNKPDIWTSTDTLYFGNVKVGRSRSQLLKVQNNGDKTLTISKLMMYASQFSFNSALEFSLEPAAYRWIEISYLPDALAFQKGYLLIISNDPDTDTLRVGLAGQGVETSPPQIKVEPYELVFDTTAIGQEKSLWLHITNTGDEVLQIQKVLTTPEQFKTNSNGFSLLTNQPYYLTVTFKPDQIGFLNGYLQIISNDPVLDTLKVNLSGFGRNAHPAKIYLATNQFDFGTIGVGKSETQNILVSNRGEASLTIEKVESTDQQFTCHVKNLIIPPQGSNYLPVVFTPGSVGSVSAAVKIYNNDPTNNQKTITVHGTGRSLYPAMISVSPEQLNFDNVPIGRQVEKNVWIFNKGEQKLTITKIQIVGQQFTAPVRSYTIDAGKFLALPVTFRPSQTGQINARLFVYSNVNPDEPVDIALTGVGRELNPAQISVKPEYLNFGAVPVNGHLSKNLYIYNNGEVPLNITQIYTENNLFSVNTSVFTINPNRSQLLIVTYSPNQMSITQTSLVLISNSTKNSTLKVPLEGQGRSAYPAQMVVRPDTIKLGSVPQYREKTYPVEIQNAGEVVLNINRITSGDDEFAIPADETSFELQPGQKRHVSVKFNPYKIREINAPISIESDAPSTPAKTVYLIGEVRKLIPANIAFQPEKVVFDSLGTGFWASKIIQVKNIGESTLNIRSITSNNDKFISTKIYKMDIPPESSQPLEIIFAPAEVKKYEAILTFESNAKDKPVADLPVEGTGREKMKQKISIDPDTLSFGTTGIARSVTRSFKISNTGENTLIINNILSSNEQFQIDSTSFKIDPSQSRMVQASFHPITVGNSNGSLTIYSNDPVTAQKQLALNGTGRNLISQQIVVTPDTLKFDSVNVEQSRQLALNVVNSGDYPLVISKIHSGDKQFTVTDTTFTVESGQAHAVPITFQPDQMGSMSTLLIIYNNDPEKQVLEVPVTGIGRLLNEQRIALDSDTLSFGAVAIGEISRQKIWVTNLGEKTLKIDSVLISRTYFTVDDNTFDVAPLSSKELWVSFKPATYDTIRARMTIKSNDTVKPTVQVGLSGTGRDLLVQKIDVSPDSLKFNPLGWGESHSKPLYIRNVGEKPLVISDIIISDTTYFKIKTSKFTIPANKS